LIDDYCPRCKRLMNHAIASFMDDKVVKVICQTCHSEHPFLEGKEKKKTPKAKASAFDQVLSKVSPSSGSAEKSSGKKSRAKSGNRPLIRHKKSPENK